MGWPILQATAARRRWRREFRDAVLLALEERHGLRYRAAAERAVLDVSQPDVIEVARSLDVPATEEHASDVADHYVAFYDRECRD